ncbi:hypothetical protein BC941DRAFT_433728 [Chlamydoabsidia padenii]|nr:hypothetical protein BC941DRAFT_433728 [Chlamydoabsidia padenii]
MPITSLILFTFLYCQMVFIQQCQRKGSTCSFNSIFLLITPRLKISLCTPEPETSDLQVNRIYIHRLPKKRQCRHRGILFNAGSLIMEP